MGRRLMTKSSSQRVKPDRLRCANARRIPGFTLIELLVVMSIMAVLFAVLLPGLSSARAAAKALECSSNMRSLVIDFGLFADGRSADGQGDSEKLGSNRFFINDYQDHLYGLDEFWDGDPRAQGAVKIKDNPMLCPASTPLLQKRSGFPCSIEAVGPAENVSIAINMRLYRASVEFKERQVLAPAAATRVSTRILQHPYVPLIMDVDGETAAKRGLEPFYIAPPIKDHNDPYSAGRYWMPSTRHHGKVNVAFTGGHVLRSARPEREHWDWSYQAKVGR